VTAFDVDEHKAGVYKVELAFRQVVLGDVVADNCHIAVGARPKLIRLEIGGKDVT
jgi:hypothetical protein